MAVLRETSSPNRVFVAPQTVELPFLFAPCVGIIMHVLYELGHARATCIWLDPPGIIHFILTRIPVHPHLLSLYVPSLYIHHVSATSFLTLLIHPAPCRPPPLSPGAEPFGARATGFENATKTNRSAGTLRSGKPRGAEAAPKCISNSYGHTENDEARHQYGNMRFAECLELYVNL